MIYHGDVDVQGVRIPYELHWHDAFVSVELPDGLTPEAKARADYLAREQVHAKRLREELAALRALRFPTKGDTGC
jgi:hypothetical protein